MRHTVAKVTEEILELSLGDAKESLAYTAQ